MMELRFFNAAGATLFVRDDMESGSWTAEELSLQALFPYDPLRVIERGMRVGFTDAVGAFQLFEIRQAKTSEPDHYQDITAEHIAIAELTDEFFAEHEFDTVTAGAALGTALTGTLWEVGTNTASGTSSYKAGTSNVWETVRAIEENWNVYITPRITVNASGITHRYLDIAPAGGTWRGLRLSLDKNTDQAGVTWDDRKVKTALYAFGASQQSGNTSTPLTFKDVVWNATADHPAKPAGQEYLEDPAATAAYGRDGRARFGYYQNSDIDNAETLLEKTWESLQTLNHPDVSIDCTVADLYRLGYGDTPMALHDTVWLDIRGTNISLQKEIIQMTVDLLNPTETRVTIGDYIPNIIYLDLSTNKSATGGGGGGGGQSRKDYEYGTAFDRNDYLISLKAWQRDMDDVESILYQAGMELDAHGVLIYATDNVNNIMSKLNVQADRISLVVSGTGPNASIKAAEIVAAINDDGTSSIKLSADKIDMDAVETYIAGYLSANDVEIGWLEILNSLSVSGATELDTLNCSSISTDGDVDVGGVAIATGFQIAGSNDTATWQSKTVVTNVSNSSQNYFLIAQDASSTTPIGVVQGQLLTGKTTATIYYLGHA